MCFVCLVVCVCCGGLGFDFVLECGLLLYFGCLSLICCDVLLSICGLFIVLFFLVILI